MNDPFGGDSRADRGDPAGAAERRNRPPPIAMRHSHGPQPVYPAARRLEAFTAATDDIVWELDRDGVITYVSASVEGHLGYQPVELIGQPWQAITTSSDHARGRALLEGTAAAHAGWSGQEYAFTTRTGRLRTMVSAGLVLTDELGTVIGFAGILRPVSVGAAADTRRLLEDIVGWRLIQPVFQAIVDLTTRRRVAAEALSRFPLHQRRSPAYVFAKAAAVGMSAELELAAVECVLVEALALPAELAVSINASPDTLISNRLSSLLTGSGIDPARIILEITEQTPVDEYTAIRKAVRRLRDLGCRLAVDDAGAGYASFKRILALAPEFIKLDRFLVTDIVNDPARRALIRSVVGFAREVGCQVIAEGIETGEQAAALRNLGLRYGQGYFIGRPAPAGTFHERGRTTRTGPEDRAHRR